MSRADVRSGTGLALKEDSSASTHGFSGGARCHQRSHSGEGFLHVRPITEGPREGPAAMWDWCRVEMAHPLSGEGLPTRQERGKRMLRKRMKRGLTVLALGSVLVLGAASCAMQGHGSDWTWGEINAYEHSPINSGAQGI